MNNRHMKMLRLAAEVAEHRGELDMREYTLGAVAVRADGAIVTSRNGPANHVCPPCHAEARVLRKAGAGAIIYVARIRRDGTWALAAPCKSCMRMIRRRRVVAVYYTVADDCYECITLYGAKRCRNMVH